MRKDGKGSGLYRVIVQFISFIGVSGVGWIIDFSLFSALTSMTSMHLAAANYISTAPAVSLVFFVSTRKIFKTSTSAFPVWVKYVLYVAYQIILVTAIGFLAQFIFEISLNSAVMNIVSSQNILKILIKIALTPFTMIANFFVMKFLSEKI